MSETVFTFPTREEAEAGGQRSPDGSRKQRLGMLEAVIFAAAEPPTAEQLAKVTGVSAETVRDDVEALIRACEPVDRGVQIRSVGGTYRVSTKPEHHEAVRALAESVQPKLRLSRAALETLAVVAYKQPVTLPEIGAIRGVTSSSGVIRTLLGHNLVAVAGRKKVVGRPICYRTTDDFLLRFGLNDLSELPTVKELKELGGGMPEADQSPDRALGTGGQRGPSAGGHLDSPTHA